MFQHVRRMGQNRLVIARCAGNGGARVDRRIASRKFAIVQEEDQRVPRFGAADQAKARHQAVSLVCEWRAPQSRPNSLARSEEHTSELQSLMRISYAVFCLKKKKDNEGTHLLYGFGITQKIHRNMHQ